MMQAVALPASGLASVRFGWSMLGQAAASLWAIGRHDQPAWIKAWWHDVGPQIPTATLETLDGLVPASGRNSYIPDFALPTPAGHVTSLDDELHAFVNTPAEIVRSELASVVDREPQPGVPGQSSLTVMDRYGEHVYLDELAKALTVYWDTALAPYWSRLRSGLDRDLHRRGTTLATDGLDRTLETIAPALVWHDGVLLKETPCDTVQIAEAPAGVRCASSAFVYGRLFTSVLATGTYTIHYPLHGTAATWLDHPYQANHALRELLGGLRADLLAGLDTPQPTSHLAVQHQQAASTVSYHLGVLHRAGLLDRYRQGRHVLYIRTPLGDLLTGNK